MFKEHLELIQNHGSLVNVLESDTVRDALIHSMAVIAEPGENIPKIGKSVREALEAAVEAEAFRMRDEMVGEQSANEIVEEARLDFDRQERG